MALLDERVVLVSGGTQGVGAAVAAAAVREGARSSSPAAAPRSARPWPTGSA